MSTTERFAIEVNFLTGRYVATAYNDRRRSEWPPHPARLFSAMVAAWRDGERPDLNERRALEWIENQAAPGIAASRADPRSSVSHFVPVNDASIVSRTLQARRASEVYGLMDLLRRELAASGGKVTKDAARLRRKLASRRNLSSTVSRTGTTSVGSARAMFPDGRGKQERRFPSVFPETPQVTYVWESRPDAEAAVALDQLLERVTRLGHSSSLVSCRIAPTPPDPTQVVTKDGTGSRLRTVRPGQLAELERMYARHQGVRPRSLPFTAVRYREATALPSDTVREPNTCGDWIVFEFAHGSRSFPATRTVELATAMRAAILAYAQDPIPEAVTGHRPDGAPTVSPHVAIVPIPFVGSRHADGRVLGIAVSIPHGIDHVSRTAVYRAIGTWERTMQEGAGDRSEYPLKLTMGTRGAVHLRRIVGGSDLASLQPEVWSKNSHRWTSVTPVALPQHPGSLTKGAEGTRAKAWGRAETAVRLACTHVDLPEPAAVALSLDPWVAGARKTAHFPPFRQRGREEQPVRRQLVHASMTFDHLVRGPLMIGAGRFFGLGLMRPVQESTVPRSVDEAANE